MRVDDFQEPLEIWFMAFIDPYKVHVLSKPRSKLNQNRSWTIHFQNNKKSWTHHAKQNRSRVTFNSVLHTRTWENLIIFNHDSRIRKIQITIHKEKKSPKHASRKKYKRLLVNHGSRQRASFIYFIKYLTCLHLDHALIWLLNIFKRFRVRF